jgi:hypothetical protein
MSERLSPEREAEVAARAEAATPGPWCTDAWEIYQGTEYVPGISQWIGETCRGATTPEQDRADAAFVAAARAERDQAQARVAELEKSRQPGKHPNIKEEFGKEGCRVVCQDCGWASKWFDWTNEYGAFKSASIFHTCETEAAR